MTTVCYHITLAQGKWKHAATPAALRRLLGGVLSSGLLSIEFASINIPSDVQVECEVVVQLDVSWGHSEVVRDNIYAALLKKFRPEYESMIEVEVYDG